MSACAHSADIQVAKSALKNWCHHSETHCPMFAAIFLFHMYLGGASFGCPSD